MNTVEIPRDRYGRPLIVPPEGGKATAYTRASTMAKVLDDLNQLLLWKQRKTLEGVIARPDLLTRTAGVLANGDPNTDYGTKRVLNEIAAEAIEAAGASKGASAGTGFHLLTEALDRGEEIPWVSSDDKVRLNAYQNATMGLEIVDAETFVVCDELRTAGSFDRLWRLADGRVVVGDLKTGKSEADYPLATCIQMAIYATGVRYTPPSDSTGLAGRGRLHKDLDQTVGLLVHMPPSGGCKVIPLNLEIGWMAAQIAATVKNEIRSLKPRDLILAQSVTSSGKESA